MKIPIDIFETLYDIARRHRITQSEWASACEDKAMTQPRIAELVKLSELERRGGGDPKKLGRSCTLEKCLLLHRGLVNLLGGSVVNKQIIKDVEKEPDLNKKLYRLVLALRSAPDATKRQAELYLTAVLQGMEEKG